jgi:lipoprotein-anchoring transpeptidase ErfK/SrfK
MRRWSVVVVAVVVVLALAAVAAAYAYDRSRDRVIAGGVRIGGVDVGGMSAGEAAEAVRAWQERSLRRPVVVGGGGRRFVLRAAEVSLRVGVRAAVEDALERSRRGNFLARTVREVAGDGLDVALKPGVSYSRVAVERFIDRIARRVERPARDASVNASARDLRVRAGRSGLALRRRVLRRGLDRALRQLGAARGLALPTESVRPRVTRARLAERYPYFITIDRARFRLHLYKRLRRVKSYVIAVGQAGYETPEGLYEIQNKAVNPAWSVPNSDWAGALAGQVIPPGPDNPLKARWMGIYDGAGIHGTAETYSLGTAASRGCIRMAIPEVKELYRQVPVGTPVYIG